MKKTIFLFIPFGLLLKGMMFSSIIILVSSCKHADKNIIINDVSIDSVYNIDLGNNPYGKIKLHVTGEVNDSIKINEVYLSGGPVDTTFLQDWFTNEVSIHLHKFKATKGNLIINVR